MFDSHVLLQLAEEQVHARLDDADHQRLVAVAMRGQSAHGAAPTGGAHAWWVSPDAGRRRARPEGTAG